MERKVKGREVYKEQGMARRETARPVQGKLKEGTIVK
jgi:hypothetical protein